MTAAAELNAHTGQLWLAESTFEVLVAHVTSTAGGVESTESAGAPAEIAALRHAGALDAQGQPHDVLLSALWVIAEPAGAIELSYKGKAMRGWVDGLGGAMLLPAGEDGRRLLTYMPYTLLPGALAKMADLGPRPRPEPARPVPYRDGALPDVRRHWRVAARWHGSNPDDPDSLALPAGLLARLDGTPEAAAASHAIDVVETGDGMWLLYPGDNPGDTGGGVVAWPTTPTTVWRKIVRLLEPSRAHRTGGKRRGG